jgi:hypothetical protein
VILVNFGDSDDFSLKVHDNTSEMVISVAGFEIRNTSQIHGHPLGTQPSLNFFACAPALFGLGSEQATCSHIFATAGPVVNALAVI